MKTVADIILISSRLMSLFIPVGLVLILTDDEFTLKKLLDYILGNDESEYSRVLRGDE